MNTSLLDVHMAEQKLKIISEKQNVLVMTTIWKGRYILMTYNTVMKMLAPLEWVDDYADEISNEDYDTLTKIIKKCVRSAWQVRLSVYIIINFNYITGKEKIMIIPHIIEDKGTGKEKVYDLFSLLMQDRIIFIRGGFDQDMADVVVAQLLYLESSDAEADINMYINSPGGEISSMYAIYDTMQYIKNDIVTIGMGTVASAASFILAAGNKGKRFSLPNANIMIHELSSGMDGKYHDMKNRFEHTEQVHNKMAKHYVEFTGQKLNKIKKDMEKDFYMSAEEAKEYGLIDIVQYKRA